MANHILWCRAAGVEQTVRPFVADCSQASFPCKGLQATLRFAAERLFNKTAITGHLDVEELLFRLSTRSRTPSTIGPHRPVRERM